MCARSSENKRKNTTKLAASSCQCCCVLLQQMKSQQISCNWIVAHTRYAHAFLACNRLKAGKRRLNNVGKIKENMTKNLLIGWRRPRRGDRRDRRSTCRRVQGTHKLVWSGAVLSLCIALHRVCAPPGHAPWPAGMARATNKQIFDVLV